MAAQPADASPLLDIAAAAQHMGVSEAFVRRLVLERRVRYFKVGKFVRFRAVDLDAFIEAGRQDPVEPWVYVRSTMRGAGGHGGAQQRTTRRRASGGRA
jgi:excisionase family DNA binding protein